VAWRPFNNNRTVVRAGYGIYTIRLLGPYFVSLTDIHTADSQLFTNSIANGTHSIVWPNTFNSLADRGNVAVGTLSFNSANRLDFAGVFRLCLGDEPIFHHGKCVGYVSSGGYAHHAKKSMAMGYVPMACAADGTDLEIELLGEFYKARVAARPVYDPDGQRMRS